ncbi:MAG: ATP-dependent sacrificial sulfur transferase LarE [Planctomycetia bacterium]|nr:ATP-dependent sacrificial sulfur transferase LarE [Planctomycetia bacterium]
MDIQAQEALEKLEEFLRQYESAVIAYSGGVDSAVVMAAATRVLGTRALACIGVSPSYPTREKKAALALAKSVGAVVRLVQTREQNNPNYAANPVNRCYYCKTELYKDLASIAREQRYAVILDGNNASDETEDRPGRKAAREYGVISPLASLGYTKPMVRLLALEMGLNVWDKPATPCLSSRVPHGVPIVPGLLARIEAAENVLAGLGFKEFRVRHHGDVARVELPTDDMRRAMALRHKIVQGIQLAGYKFVTLDLSGFKTGALHTATKRSMTPRIN